ncbi:DNA helicase [Tanacetum coccineum]
MKNHLTTTSVDQTVYIGRNTARCFTTARSTMVYNVDRIPTYVGIIGRQDTGDRTTVPIRRVFDRFKNMCTPRPQSDYVTSADISCHMVSKHPLTTLNHAYLCLDADNHSINIHNDCQLNAEVETLLDGVDGNTLPTTFERDGTTVSVFRISDRFRNMNIGGSQSDSTMNTARSTMVDNVDRIPTSVGIIGHQDTRDRTTVPIRRIFDRFRNMPCPVLSQTMSPVQPLTMLNHAYLCLDADNHIVRPQIINFERSDGDSGHRHHLPAEHSRDRTNNAPNELFPSNCHKRKKQPPSLAAHSRNALLRLNIQTQGSRYSRRAEYHLCYRGGKIYMPTTPDPLAFIQQLLTNVQFMENIHAYNQMFSMTSFGEKINDSVNRGRGPYVFKISGQIYHWIGSMCPEEGDHPRCLQLYIYDTYDEVNNRMRHFGGLDRAALNPDIVEGLMHVLDEHNSLVRLFRTARDRCNACEIPGFKVRLYNMGSVRGYELLTSDCIRGIVFESGPRSRTDFDFPLLFIFGQPGFYPELILKPRNGRGQGKKVTMNAYYKYQLHPREKEFRLIFKGERGDHEGIAVGSMIMLPSTFTDGPRVVEFQKRGLPYCHTLLWVDSRNKIHDASQIDEYISAELPDHVQDPRGYKVVSEMMMHGPCGAENLSTSCVENGSCSKHFPKRYNDKIFFNSNGHMQYRRRDTGVHVMRHESRLDNCNLVPYNRVLCLAFEAHINVEYCGCRCKSLVEVRTIKGQILPTYKAACKALGLLGDDKEWDIALQESATSATSVEIITLFAQILIYCDVSDLVKLWNKRWEAMRDDIPKKVSEATRIPDYHVNTVKLQGYILYELEAILNGFGKSVKDFGIKTPPEHLLKDLENKLLMEEKNYNRELLMQDVVQSIPKLNPKKRKIYDMIMNACTRNEQKLLFIYGHGETGKTFMWKTLISSMRSQGKIVLAVASSGIASLLLPAGRTAHPRFKLLLELTDEPLCHVKKHPIRKIVGSNKSHYLG